MPYVRTLIFALVAGAPSVGLAACDVHSGPGTAALVELYTSEGCSSCPPADRQLGQLRQGATLVPLALHVGYWDDLGWRDPYAQDGFAERQSALVELGGSRALYTPQFFVGGTAMRPMAVADRVRQLNGQAPKASIHLKARIKGDNQLAINASAESAIEHAALYLAVAENGLSSQVRDGENRGRRLSHDHVVRTWIGPLALYGGSVALERSIPLAQIWQRDQLEIVGFVQDQESGRVLQAVGASQCAGAGEAGS
jgi:hypothetical protein